ncbi:MAG TPA: HAD family phosphatase [Candidatus Omnitrophota bacterium]|nr:HAD family phosphatase [Candidatus Omnitrophota bacterium]
MAAIHAIIFDLGKVLVDFDHMTAGRKIALLTGKSPEQIYELFFNSPLIRSFEQGDISPEVFFAGVQQRIDLDIPFDQFVAIWNNIFYMTESNAAVYDLLAVLRPKYTLAMLSNINALHYAYLKERLPVFDRFHHLFASCEMGLVKPDERIYRTVLDRLGVPACETFYTDDRPDMVAAARALGIEGFVFAGIGQLKRDLAGCGVETGA